MENKIDLLLAKPRERLASDLRDGLANGTDAEFSASLVSLRDALPTDALLSYVTISFLHTELLKGNSPYLVEAFGEAWISEEALAVASYNASRAFDAWRRYEEEAREELRKNGRGLPETIFRSRISKDLELVRFAVQSTVKYAIPEAEELFSPYAVPSGILVSIGEYRGRGTVIARLAAPPEDSNVRYDALFSVRKDWRFARFEGTRFESLAFESVDFGGARFENCGFCDCRFSDCKITDALFSDCVFEKALFENCALYGTAFGAEFSDTLFRGSNAGTRNPAKAGGFFLPALWLDCKANGIAWENCDFSGADFENCDFRGAVRKESDFGGTIFEGPGIAEVSE
jgi:hypothetical protein